MTGDGPEVTRNAGFYLRRIGSHLRNQIRRALPKPYRTRQLPEPDIKKPHWVLCFYGVDRSLKYTSYGIHRHLIAPLVRRGAAITVIAHFNQIDTIAGHYSKEGAVAFRRDRISSLNPDILWVERQRDAAIDEEMQQLEGVDWGVRTPLFTGSKKNLMHQLHSLSRVSQLIQMADLHEPVVFALLRADLQYLDDLDVENIQDTLMSGQADIITPDWQKWGGLNDRFAFVSPGAVHTILNRRSLAGEFGRKYGFIHAEKLLLFAAQSANLRHGFTSMRAERVRGTGRVAFESFSPQ